MALRDTSQRRWSEVLMDQLVSDFHPKKRNTDVKHKFAHSEARSRTMLDTMKRVQYKLTIIRETIICKLCSIPVLHARYNAEQELCLCKNDRSHSSLSFCYLMLPVTLLVVWFSLGIPMFDVLDRIWWSRPTDSFSFVNREQGQGCQGDTVHSTQGWWHGTSRLSLWSVWSKAPSRTLCACMEPIFFKDKELLEKFKD